MINSTSEVRDLLSAIGGGFSNNRVAELPIDGVEHPAFAIEINGRPLDLWAHLRQRVDQTGRWPVLTLLESPSGDDWHSCVKGSDLFSRFYFEEEDCSERDGNDPNSIIEAARGPNAGERFRNLPEDDGLSLVEYVEVCQDGSELTFGKAPDITDVESFLQEHSLHSLEAIERWFFQWELDNCNKPMDLPEHGLSHLNWFESEHMPPVILLMPSKEGWDVPAYLHWYGALRCDSESVVAQLRDWHEKYGAELVANFGTMLQLNVARQPQTADEAFDLAWLQTLIAPCTTILPGVSPRDHARALFHTNKWFLHERP